MARILRQGRVTRVQGTGTHKIGELLRKGEEAAVYLLRVGRGGVCFFPLFRVYYLFINYKYYYYLNLLSLALQWKMIATTHYLLSAYHLI